MRHGNAKRAARRKGNRRKRSAAGGTGSVAAVGAASGLKDGRGSSANGPGGGNSPVGSVPEPDRSTRGRESGSSGRCQRLVVQRVAIPSIFKLSLIFYLALSCVILVAAMLLWLLATISGVRSNVEKFVGDLFVAEDFRLVGTKMLQLGVVLGLALTVIGTAANLVMATLYNLISDVVGGVSVVVEGGQKTAEASEPVKVSEAELRPPRRGDALPRRH